MNDNKKGVILCLLSAFCYALGPIIGKLLFNIGMPWQVVAPVRGMIPGILLLIYALIFAKQVFKIKREHLKWFILNGISFGFISVCNYCSIFFSLVVSILYSKQLFLPSQKEKHVRPDLCAQQQVYHLCCP